MVIKVPQFMARYANNKIDRISKDGEANNRAERISKVSTAIFEYSIGKITIDETMRIISET